MYPMTTYPTTYYTTTYTTTQIPTGAFTHQHSQACEVSCQNLFFNEKKNNNQAMEEERCVYAPVEAGVVGGIAVWRQIHDEFVRAMDAVVEQPPLLQPQQPLQPIDRRIRIDDDRDRINEEAGARIEGGAGAFRGAEKEGANNNNSNNNNNIAANAIAANLLSSSLSSLSSSSRSGGSSGRRSLPNEFMKMIKKLKMSSSSKNCSICVAHFVKDEVIRQLPCGHIFHEGCLKPWLRDNSVCPNCRFDLFAHFSQQSQQ